MECGFAVEGSSSLSLEQTTHLLLQLSLTVLHAHVIFRGKLWNFAPLSLRTVSGIF